MANSPTKMALGIGGIGFGSLVLYAAVKNLPLLGDKGVFRTFFTTGKLTAPASTSGGTGASGAAAGAPTPTNDGNSTPPAGTGSGTINVGSTDAQPSQPKVVGQPTTVLTNNSPGPYYWLPEGFGVST